MRTEEEIIKELNNRFMQIRKARSTDEIVIACAWFNALNWVLLENEND